MKRQEETKAANANGAKGYCDQGGCGCDGSCNCDEGTCTCAPGCC